jgi:hypothetical protein
MNQTHRLIIGEFPAPSTTVSRSPELLLIVVSVPSAKEIAAASATNPLAGTPGRGALAFGGAVSDHAAACLSDAASEPAVRRDLLRVVQTTSRATERRRGQSRGDLGVR